MALDWLKYANQGATRDMPLSPELVKALSFLPELGVSMEVFSGGQPGEGPDRVGSHRHDHGNAADVFFSKGGHRLDWSNPKDRTVFENIVNRAHEAGVTGFGAGPGYMQPGSMHIGFGTPAVWGAGGKGANAPDWLRSAFNGTVQQPSPEPAQQPAPPLDAPVEVATLPARAAMGSIAPQTTAQAAPQARSIPQAVMDAAKTADSTPERSTADYLAMLGSMAPQQPQFSPVQIMGPSPEQANALSSLVAALKSRMA